MRRFLLLVWLPIVVYSLLFEGTNAWGTRTPQRRRPSIQLTQQRNALHVASTSSPPSGDSSTSMIPFLIEKLPQNPSNFVYSEIATMCIQAFFNDTTHRFVPFWKEFQLSFLRRLQTADLERRRRNNPDTNVMFLARSVVPATRDTVRRSPLILNLDNIVHREYLNHNQNDVVRDQLVGFVEVTLKPYGLGNHDDHNGMTHHEEDDDTVTVRPVLTNLSVVKSARRSGVGSHLMRACEDYVANVYHANEIILEVEDDNEIAIQFYHNLGYTVLFADTAARRYDVNGLFLQQKRCTRLVMRKRLVRTPPTVVSMFHKLLRETYLSVVEAR